jgi:methylenetetrahydrofolate dehydrogenase (NADP+) / methenyltetrahydrofolate cyclohydrolase
VDPADRALVMDGRRLRDEVVADLRARIAAAGDPPVKLATVVVADDELSRTHVGYKHAAAARAGIAVAAVQLPADAAQGEVEDAVGSLADDPSVDGVFVQLPIPAALDGSAVLELVPPEKDIDGLTQRSLGRLMADLPGHVPATPLAILRLLQRYGRPTAGRHAVILDRSWTVGRPLAMLLSREGVDATVTLIDDESGDPRAVCREADIVLAGLGRPRSVTGGWIKPGATVIDLGVTRTSEGIVGDVDVADIAEVAGAICPNPGGIGPATVACLLQSTLTAARMRGRFPADDEL